MRQREDVRRGDDDFGISELLVEFAILTLLVGGRHESVTLVLEPFSDAKLILSRS